ncbi:MAG: MarR family transcriptional regulator [Pseudodesulfovibrio sp.]
MLVRGADESGISYQLLRVAWLLFDFDKKTHTYGTDQELYEAEIHLIVAIKDNPGLHVAGLAQKFGVTKGAVSQLVQKLAKKGMISRQVAPDNQSRILLSLTGKGSVAYAGHAAVHAEFEAMVERVLASEPEEKQAFLKRFLCTMAHEIESRVR